VLECERNYALFAYILPLLEEWIFRDELFRQLTLDRVCPNPDSNLRLLDLVIADLLSKIDPDFDAADVLSSTQLCDVVNDRGPEDNEVERDVAGISKSFENENVEMASKDPKSMNEVNVAESSSSTFAGVESRKRNASGSSNGKVFCLVFYCLEMD